MKKVLFIIVILCILLVAVGCQKELTCGDVEKIFRENQCAFKTAAKALTDVPAKQTLSIEKEDPKNERLDVVHINNLFFCGYKLSLSKQDCENLFAVVEPLFSDAGIKGITCNSDQIQFSIYLEYGYESSIVFCYAGEDPTGSFPDIIDKAQLESNWYAVVARD